MQSQPGRWQEAADAYQAALDAKPTSGDAYHNLGTIHQRLGRYDDARRMYEASLKVCVRTSSLPRNGGGYSARPLVSARIALLQHRNDLLTV